MKKYIILLACVWAFAMALYVQADATYNEQYEIPKAISSPTIDGVINGSEWDNALHRVLSTENTINLTGAVKEFPPVDLYWMWDENGFYYFADVTDTTLPATVHTPGGGSYNSGDGVQLSIYPDISKSGSSIGDLYFISMVVTNDGSAAIGEHFVHGTGSAGKDIEGAVIACTQDGTNYTLEVFIPAECWTASNKPLVFETGTTFAMTNVLMEQDGGKQSLICDSAWFDGTSANKYTLTDDPAGQESGIVFADELPTAYGAPVLAAGAGADDITGYSGSVDGLEADQAGFTTQEDGCVRYDFAVETTGKYAVVIPYTAPEGKNCAINVAVDTSSGGSYVDLVESNSIYYAVIPCELTAGKHSMYIMSPYGYNGETVQSGTVYGWNLYFWESYGTPVSVVLYGDINGDNLLNRNDERLLASYFAGYTVAIPDACVDLDGSGTFTRRDVMILKRYLAGWEEYTIPYAE